MNAYFSTQGITVQFGGLTAVNSVDLAITEGSIHGIIGPNGAGKTTLFNTITGLVPLASGGMIFDGTEISRLAAYQRAQMGIRRTFQSVQLIPQFTVLENVLVGLHDRISGKTIRSLFGFTGRNHAEEIAQQKVIEILSFLGIEGTLFKRPAELTFAEQRFVEIARALVAQPKMLMLDEPAAGLSPNEVTDLNRLLRRIRTERAVTVVLVEHVLSLVLDVSDRITVLENGAVIGEGTPAEIANDPRVKVAYLGEHHA